MAEKVNKTLRFVAKVQEDLKKDNEKSKDRSLQLADILHVMHLPVLMTLLLSGHLASLMMRYWTHR